MHGEHMQIENGKIGKSLGNAVNLRNLLDRSFTGDDYRYLLLMTHYRSHLNFSFESLKSAKAALFRLKRHVYEEYKNTATVADASYLEKFTLAINNDLDTPKAIALVWEMVKDTNLASGVKCATLKEFDKVLQIGLSDELDDAMFKLGVVQEADIPAEIQDLINAREAARIARNWDESDRLRSLLNFKGYAIEDTPGGPKVSKS